jgi:hypothetical protein
MGRPKFAAFWKVELETAARACYARYRQEVV